MRADARRIAAPIAVEAPPASCLTNAGAAADSGVAADDIQAVMIGIAPVVGTPRVVAAGGNILAALVFEIMVAGPQHRLTALAGIRSTPVLCRQPVRRLALTRLPGRCEDEYARRSLPGTAAAKGLPTWTDV